MWGGAIYYPPTAYPSLVDKIVDFANDPIHDPDKHLIAAAGYSPQGAACVADIYYATATPQPLSLAPFSTIQPQLFNTLREDSLLGFANEQAAFSTDGDRQFYLTTTFRVDRRFMLDIHGLYENVVEKYKTIPGFTLSLVFQPLTIHMLRASLSASASSSSPNSLGLSPSRGPLIICLLSPVHSNKADDQTMETAMTGLLRGIEKLAEERGVSDGYRFLNYAFRGERVLEGYGESSLARMRSVSARYDGVGFWQGRVKGGFKILV